MTNIPHIDARTINEITLDNQRLKEKLKYNRECLKIKRTEIKEKKLKQEFKQNINKAKKVFAFKINKDKLTQDDEKNIKDIFKNIAEKNNVKIQTMFIMNNLTYLKLNTNISIPTEKLSLPDGSQMEQINPKNILNNY
jgi:hypothetical protein